MVARGGRALVGISAPTADIAAAARSAGQRLAAPVVERAAIVACRRAVRRRARALVGRAHVVRLRALAAIRLPSAVVVDGSALRSHVAARGLFASTLVGRAAASARSG